MSSEGCDETTNIRRLVRGVVPKSDEFVLNLFSVFKACCPVRRAAVV